MIICFLTFLETFYRYIEPNLNSSTHVAFPNLTALILFLSFNTFVCYLLQNSVFRVASVLCFLYSAAMCFGHLSGLTLDPHAVRAKIRVCYYLAQTWSISPSMADARADVSRFHYFIAHD